MAIKKAVLDSIREIIKHEQGLQTGVRLSTVVIDDEVDVKAIRERLGLSQQQFAQAYALPVATIQNWESGRRKPELAARRLLKVIASSPDLVAKVIRDVHDKRAVHTQS